MTDIGSTEGQPLPRRRTSDRGMLCWIAMRFSQLWDFIDKRDIDKHCVSVAILAGTWNVTDWAMVYAVSHSDRPGLEVAAIIAAVLVPYNALQAAAISFYFKARTE